MNTPLNTAFTAIAGAAGHAVGKRMPETTSSLIGVWSVGASGYLVQLKGMAREASITAGFGAGLVSGAMAREAAQSAPAIGQSLLRSAR